MQGLGQKGRRASVVLGPQQEAASSTLPTASTSSTSIQTMDGDIEFDHLALVFSSGEREFVSRLCQGKYSKRTLFRKM